MQNIEPPDLAPIKANATKAVSFANKLEIKDDKGEEAAVAELSYINGIGDTIEAKKDKILRPLLDATKATREMFKPMEENIKSAVDTIKAKLLAYHKAKTEKAAKETAAISARAEKGTLTMGTAVKKLGEIDQAKKKVSTAEGSVGYKTVKKVRIIDASKIPATYYDLNEVKVRKDALAGVAIPGVEVYDDQEIVNKR